MPSKVGEVYDRFKLNLFHLFSKMNGGFAPLGFFNFTSLKFRPQKVQEQKSIEWNYLVVSDAHFFLPRAEFQNSSQFWKYFGRTPDS